jgi:hypothetical protein
VFWNIDDIFNGQAMIVFETFDEYQRLLMYLFGLPLEMGVLAERCPHSSFAIGGCSKTWGVPEQFDVFASAVRLGIAMAGTNVASGIHNYAAMAHLLLSDQWHFENIDATLVAFAAWVKSQAEHTLMIQDGTLVLPQQYVGDDNGQALVAADTSGRRLTAGDAYGMGQPLTDISPSRWSETHSGRRPPIEWAWPAGNPNSQGQPQNAVHATVPWILRPGVALNPKAVGIECEELSIHSLMPRWLNAMALTEMSDGWTRAGLTTHLAGLNAGEQMVAHHLAPVCVAQNVLCHGFPGRVIACVKTAWDLRGMLYLRWSSLEDVDVCAMPLESGPKIPVGRLLFSFSEADPRQLNMTNAERDAIISMCRTARLPDVGEDEFITWGYLAKMMDSDALGKAMRGKYFDTCLAEQRAKMLAQKTPTPQYIVQVNRELLRAVGVHADVGDGSSRRSRMDGFEPR